jgi:hypothetical protein
MMSSYWFQKANMHPTLTQSIKSSSTYAGVARCVADHARLRSQSGTHEMNGGINLRADACWSTAVLRGTVEEISPIRHHAI